MHIRDARGTYIPFLALFVVLAILAVGCGGQGGEDAAQANGGSGSKPEKKAGAGKAGAGKAAAAPPQTKIALGTISSINAGERRMFLSSRMSEGVMRFRIMKEPEVTVDGRSAEISEVKKGQQVKVEYIVRNDLNHARALDVFGG